MEEENIKERNQENFLKIKIYIPNRKGLPVLNKKKNRSAPEDSIRL